MYVCNRKKGMRFSHDLIETAYNKLMTSVQYTGEVSFLRVMSFLQVIYRQRENAFKHVDFLILLRRLSYSENLNSPSAQTVSLSLYTMLAKFQKSSYCLQSFSLCRYDKKIKVRRNNNGNRKKHCQH